MPLPTPALLFQLGRHLLCYLQLGVTAAAEYRSAWVRRIVMLLVGVVAAIAGLIALWITGLVAVWDTPWPLTAWPDVATKFILCQDDRFFPAAFTKGCTVECKSLAANGDKIRQYDVAYFMASVDPIEKNTDFAKSEKADFPLLSDPTKEVATSYGVLNPKGMASRWTFYIGRDGRILAIDKAVRVETSAEDMVAKLGELNIAKARSN